MTHPLPTELDAGLALLDRQIVDSDGRMVAKVDDVELEQRDDGRIVVTGLLTGPGALGPRIGGAVGVLSRATWSRLAGRDADRPRRIGYEHVVELGTVITLAVSRRTVDVDGFETWVRERLIKAIPGASKEPE
jgi:sporulation protein YlmC with PRC-barrel domain